MSEDASGTERIGELEADNRRLRRLLEQRDAPGELRHRLRNTMAMLRSIIRKSADSRRDLDDYVAHLEDRLDALGRAQARADEHGSVDLHHLIADELFHYKTSEDDRAVLSGPDLHLRPRAGQVFALALHELAVNSVEHGALGTGAGRVEVAWAVTDTERGRMLTLDWRERGTAGPPETSRSGFGTEVLTRLLAYELNAETALAVEPDGLSFTARLPLHGHEVVDATP